MRKRGLGYCACRRYPKVMSLLCLLFVATGYNRGGEEGLVGMVDEDRSAA